MNETFFAKVKQAKSPEELLALAKESGYTPDAEKAEEFFEKLQSWCELPEDALDKISGGRYEGSQERIQYGERREKTHFEQLEFIKWFTCGQTGDSETPLLLTEEKMMRTL